MKVSWQAQLFECFLKIIHAEYHVYKLTHQTKRPKTFFLKALFKNYQWIENKINGYELVTINPNSHGNKHIIYFHGGGYVLPIQYLQWQLVKKLIDDNNITISVINYPLAPENNHQKNYQVSLASYDHLINQFPEDMFILAGDSAGGGLSLGLLQELLHQEYKKLPHALILISPWLNLSRTTAELDEVKHCDKLISSRFTDYCAKAYSQSNDKKHRRISPIFGIDIIKDKWPALEKNNFKAITLYSSDELIREDSETFETKTKAFSDNFLFSAYPKMQHVWMLFPLPETKKAFNEIKAFIQSL